MNQQHFEKWNDMVKTMQKPFQDIAELNIKTLQGLTYVKPEELSKIKKPEELIEKQIDLAIKNGRIALDYMQKSFQIMEKAMLDVVEQGKKVKEEKK